MRTRAQVHLNCLGGRVPAGRGPAGVDPRAGALSATGVNPMPKPGLPPDAQDALLVLDGYLDAVLPGARVDLPILRATDGVIDGFAVSHDGGLSLLYVDATGAEADGQWILQMCAVLAVDVLDVVGALLWVNNRNRRSAIDRYFCALSPDGGACAVAADTTVSSLLLADFARRPSMPVMNMLARLVRNTVYSASTEAEHLLRTCSGRRLTTSESDLTTLFLVCAG